MPTHQPAQHVENQTFGIFNRARLRFARADNADTAYVSFATAEDAREYAEARGIAGPPHEFVVIDTSLEGST